MKQSSIVIWLLVSLGMFVATTAMGADNVVVTAKAREHFKAGVAYIDDPAGSKYEEAYREFHLAYAESPTYRILTNIGLCALNLERDGEAIEAYTEFLAHATPQDIPKDKRTIMERDIAMLKASLVRLSVTTSPSNVRLIDERLPSKGTPVTNRYVISDGKVALGIHPGQHRITVQADGYEPQVWEFEADSASIQAHEFKLALVGATKKDESATTKETSPERYVTTPPQTQEKKSYTWVYVGAATTAVFGGFSVAAHLNVSHAATEYGRTSSSSPDRATWESYYNDWNQLKTAGLVATGVAAAGTMVLYLTAPTIKTEAKTGSSRWLWTPEVTRDRASLTVTGRF